MPGWHDHPSFLEAEYAQSLEEGRDPAAIEALRAEAAENPTDLPRLEAIHARHFEVPILPDFPFQEPDDLGAIRALRSARPERGPVEIPENLPDRMLGAWLGRCVGCALGKPVEMFMDPFNGLSSRQRQKRYLQAISPSEWPLRDYFPGHSPAEEETGKVLAPESTRERIAYMETDDDIRYTVLGQTILQAQGTRFDTWHVAWAWMEYLGYNKVCTAESQAYRNLVDICDFHQAATQGPPSPELWPTIATRLNPYREWIGAQIRIDAYGYAAAGQPELAAELAYRDARLSHVKNGIYGAMFCSAMIAAAFVRKDVHAVVEAGLAEIPVTSRLYAAITQTRTLCQNAKFSDFEAIFDELERRFGHYHPVHTINNAALCTAALLLSKGNFEAGVTLAVMGGWDTDCNGATVGSILGAFNGAQGIPPFWKNRLNDSLRSGICDYHPIAISECAARSCENWENHHCTGLQPIPK